MAAEPGSLDVAQLPQDVREKLAELDLELSEGKYFLAFLELEVDDE
jgi:hypothetical protein